MRRASASAKINLALVVGPRRADGKHEVVTVLQRIDIADRLELQPSATLRVDGFAEDGLIRRALELVAEAAGTPPCWRVRIEKRIPIAAGLGGGSSDAAVALRLGNEALGTPLGSQDLHRLAAELGADVPFFLADGPQLATGDGTELAPIELPQDFWIVVVLPAGSHKRSTADVYAGFDERDGSVGFEQRRAALHAALDGVARPPDLASLPPNDLGTSTLANDLRALGAFRADVSGAGPAVYGLFMRERDAARAASALRPAGRVWVTAPAWYG